MSSLVINGDTSGSITIAAPAVAGSPTLTLQTTTGTLALQSDGIGFSQTWQVVTGSRALSTVYYNTTTKPIMAFVRLTCGPGEVQGAFVQVNGVNVGAGSSAANGQSQVTFIVPPSQSYEVQQNSGSPTLGTWAELR